MSVATKNRPFRSDASLSAEREARDAVVPFLNSRGYRVLENKENIAGTAIEQFISALTPEGQPIKMRVRLCWRRDGRNSSEQKYAAAQLRARLIDGDWDGTLRFIQARDRAHDVTHSLFVQRDAGAFAMAALIPSEALAAIWQRQREISADLQRDGLIGRIRKNHATNGSSPTLWLQDDRTPDAHRVADALWAWPDVVDLVKVAMVTLTDSNDDTFDDCPGVDYAALGADGAARRLALRSEVKRDHRVRLAVLRRAAGCERPSCRETRPYAGFLDVHHILGVEKSDRVWNCVALCPNCHREAHVSPTAEALNAELLVIAQRFAPHAAPPPSVHC